MPEEVFNQVSEPFPDLFVVGSKVAEPGVPPAPILIFTATPFVNENWS
jgi:hypothetical protein